MAPECVSKISFNLIISRDQYIFMIIPAASAIRTAKAAASCPHLPINKKLAIIFRMALIIVEYNAYFSRLVGIKTPSLNIQDIIEQINAKHKILNEDTADMYSSPEIIKTTCLLSIINPTIDENITRSKPLKISLNKVLYSLTKFFPHNIDNLGIVTIKIAAKPFFTIW